MYKHTMVADHESISAIKAVSLNSIVSCTNAVAERVAGTNWFSRMFSPQSRAFNPPKLKQRAVRLGQI